jgi:predicted nuclease with TOPRIM domain
MQELELLNNKLDTLLQKYTALQVENKRLQGALALQTKSMEDLNGKLAKLEQNIAASAIGKDLLKDDEKQAVKKQLDTVIAEIDKILATLND